MSHSLDIQQILEQSSTLVKADPANHAEQPDRPVRIQAQAEEATVASGSTSTTGTADATDMPAPTPLQDELILEARQQVTIRCGKSSITLYPNGKIALRGEYIVSDAEGVNRIAGGQIELN